MNQLRSFRRKYKIYRTRIHKFFPDWTKLFLISLLSIFLLLVFASYLDGDIRHQVKDHGRYKLDIKLNFSKHLSNITRKYIINTPTCKIPEIDPFNSEVASLIHKKPYMSCSKTAFPLTYITKENTRFYLKVNKSLLHFYSDFQISCCYAIVQRDSTWSEPDKHIKFLGCTYFADKVVIADPVIYVSCRNIFLLKIYANVHAIISTKQVEKDKVISADSAFSVLLVGIDSMSITNLKRAMPNTNHFLHSNRNFISLNGYVKVALNTLPNLMAVLGGVNLTQMKQCDYTDYIDGCYNVWKVFQKLGYITAYGEDAVDAATFNCCGKKGFRDPPTDFYFRTYMMAAEKLGVVKRDNMNYCAGPETEGERILNLAKDFQITFKHQAKFGLFWMNTFSHDDVNLPSAMDAKIEDFLKEITTHLDNTFLFFFSDHGLRFGEIRMTYSGWFEERVPFFYVYVPESFKNLYPEKYKNLQINSERLTSPFDVHMTLQDVLFLADKNYTINQSQGCPLCHSLFTEMSKGRTCQDAAISEEWCVCNVSSYIQSKELMRSSLAIFFVDEINRLILNHSLGYKCIPYKLHEIKFAGISQFNTLIIRVQTHPKGIFEGVYKVSSRGLLSDLQLLGKISRLDRYATHSWCIKDSSFEMYCHCSPNWYVSLTKIVCLFLGDC